MQSRDAYLILYKRRSQIDKSDAEELQHHSAVFTAAPTPMSSLEKLAHLTWEAERTVAAGRDFPTPLQARYELNAQRAREAYEEAMKQSGEDGAVDVSVRGSKERGIRSSWISTALGTLYTPSKHFDTIPAQVLCLPQISNTPHFSSIKKRFATMTERSSSLTP